MPLNDSHAAAKTSPAPSLRRNVVANYLGQGWSALMGLAFVPVYIHYLGIEAYGLIGFLVVLQTWLSILDSGLTPTLSREMSRFLAGAHTPQSIGNLLRSVELAGFALSAAVLGSVWVASDWLAYEWLQAGRISLVEVALSIKVMALIVAARFLEALYRGAMAGLQRQVQLNVLGASLSTLRNVGAVAVLAWGAPTLVAFMYFQAVMSMLSLLVFAMVTHSALPRTTEPAHFDSAALARVRGFMGGMFGISVLALLLTQVDKLLLSRLLPLEGFGVYMLAAAVAGVLSMLIGPVSSAFYPRLVQLVAEGETPTLIQTYHGSAQLVAVFTAPVLMLLTFQPTGIVYAWSGDAGLAARVAPVLAPLALGTFLNGLMHMPYHLQLAYGWTSLTLKTNLVAVALLVPAILWLVPMYGGVAAAWIWAALNAGYVVVAVQLMHRRLLQTEQRRWYLEAVLLPTLAAAAAAAVCLPLQPAADAARWVWVAFLLLMGGATLLAAMAGSSTIRARAVAQLVRLAAVR